MHTKGSKKSCNKPFKFLLQKYVPFSFVLWMQSRKHLFQKGCERGHEKLPEQQEHLVPNTWAPRSILVGWFYIPLEDSAFQNRHNWNGFSLCVLFSLFSSLHYFYICLSFASEFTLVSVINFHAAKHSEVCNQLSHFLIFSVFGFRKVQLWRNLLVLLSILKVREKVLTKAFW